MNVSDLNCMLELEARGAVPDGAGGFVESWSTVGTLWARKVPRTGRVTGGEEARLSLAGWRITVRAAPVGAAARPVAGQRFREGARVFAILSVAEREPRWLECVAEEEAAT